MPPRKTNPTTTAKATTTKRKARVSPSRAFASLALSEPWMPKWAESALTTASAEEACEAVHLSLADYADARKRDPVFDDLCRMLDQIVDLRITEKLRAEAIKGDIRSQTVYYVHVRDLIIPEAAGHPAETLLSATIAEAMLNAGLIAAAPAGPPALPKPKASRPNPPRSRDPDDDGA